MNNPNFRKKRILVSNQAIGPLFETVLTSLRERYEVDVFIGAKFVKKSLISRLYSWLAYSLQFTIYLLLNSRKYDLIFVSTNPPFVPLLCYLSSKPYSLLIYDLYPDVIYSLNLSRGFQSIQLLFIKIWATLNRQCFSKAFAIYTLSEQMKAGVRNYLKNHSDSRIYVVPPWSHSICSQFSNNDNDIRQRFDISG